jgi:O-antigen/teichoic acid export membrane protein
VALAVLAPEVVRVLIGTKWEASIILVQLLAVQGLLRSQLAFAGSVVMGAGRASLMLGRTAIETLVKFGVIAIAVPHGITAVAIAVVASSYATAPLTLWVLRRASGVDLATYLRQLVRPVALALSMGAAIAGVKALLVAANHPDAAVVLVVGLAAGGAVYVGLALVFAPDLVADMRSTLARLRGRSRS